MTDNYNKHCTICGKEKTGKFVPFLNRYIYNPCQCEKDKEAEQLKKDIRAGKIKLFDRYLTIVGLTGQNRQHTFSTYNPLTEKEKGNKEQCIRYADNPLHNLIFIGGTGTGKTHLVSAILYQVCYNLVKSLDDTEIQNYIKSDNLPKPAPALYIRECDILDIVRKSSGKSFQFEKEREIKEQCKSRKLLCIDDIGVQEKYERDDILGLYDIIDTRYNSNLPTIITSNLLPDELKQNIGVRVYDRLKSEAVIINIDGKSHRKPKEITN